MSTVNHREATGQVRMLRPVRLRLGSWPASSVGLIAAGLALVLPLLSIRVMDSPAWTPRYALLPIEAAIGLPLLGGLMTSSFRRPAIAAASFAAVSSVSMLASDNPSMSFWGNEYFGTGVLFIFAMIGVWAIGVCAGSGGARAVERALFVGVTANAVVALVQVFVDLARLGAANNQSQPTGLVGQPVHLGALLLGGWWLYTRRWTSGGTAMAFGVVLMGTAIEVTGERLPLALCLVVPVVFPRRSDVRGRLRVLGLTLFGVLIGFGLTQVHRVPAPSATSRVAITEQFGARPRLENYEGALKAFVERPILGWGPGRYVAGVTVHRSITLERLNPDSYFLDAHDWPLHYAVTTGVAGLGALVAWLGLAARRASGSLLGFALMIGVIELLQPQDIGVTAIALLALGAASTIDHVPRSPVPVFVRGAVLVLAGGVAGLIAFGGWLSYRGEHGDPASGVAVARLLPHWPDRAQHAAELTLARDDLSSAQRLADAARWTDSAVARDPGDVRVVGSVGYDFLLLDQPKRAEEAFRSALTLSPHSPNILVGLGIAIMEQGRTEDAVNLFERALAISPNNALARKSLESARNPTPP